MISIDTNIFIHAYNPCSHNHESAVLFIKEIERGKGCAICDLVLIEVYMQLRNKAIMPKVYSAREAAEFCRSIKNHQDWIYIQYSPLISDDLWRYAENTTRGFRHIIDARIALTLRHHGVTEFATTNIKDFEGFGFKRLFNPLEV